MKIENKIFGSVEVTEPPLVDLVNSPPLQRLKGVHNGGPCQYIHQNLEQMTRFNHCLGVMLLLRHFGAALAEQLAGLLHDVSHTAFSHLADYVFGGDVYKLDYQDNILGEFILKSEIPEILARHGLAVEKVQDPHGFSLLEQKIPDLCADRLEYSLAHPMMTRHLAPLSAQNILAHVVVDLSGRPYLSYNVKIRPGRVGSFDTDLPHEFFQAFANQLGMNLHINVSQGENPHQR